jgi:hypothetical protein
VCDPLAKTREGEESGSVARSESFGKVLWDRADGNEVVRGIAEDTTDSAVTDDDFSDQDSGTSPCVGDDGDLLDLLVDTLDVEFDPNLLV